MTRAYFVIFALGVAFLLGTANETAGKIMQASFGKSAAKIIQAR